MQPAIAESPTVVWVSGTTGMSLTQTTPRGLKRLVDAGLVRMRRLPGAHPRYALADLEAVQRQGTEAPPAA